MRWSWERPSAPYKYKQWFRVNLWWLKIAVILAFTIVVIVAFWRGKWLDWVGFRGKTLWNWLELLGVPLSITGLGLLFQYKQQKRADEASRLQRQIAIEEANEEVLQLYLDRVSSLLIEKQLIAVANKVYSFPKEILESKVNTNLNPSEKATLDTSVNVIRAMTLGHLYKLVFNLV